LIDLPIYHPIPVLKTRQKSKIHFAQERRKSTRESGLTRRTTNIIKERDGTNGIGDTVSPSFNHPITAVEGSDIVELHTINNTTVVVRAAAAHVALIS
jgi:hypothetical protein